MSTVVYSSLSDKQARYVRRTIPLIFLRASEAVNSIPYPNTPQRIHETARAGNYVAEYGPKDEVKSVEETLRHGGDCEDWAAYQLAAAYTHAVPVRLVTAGDGDDHFAHVYVEFKDPQTGRWEASNPKGDQPGMDYKLPSRWPVKRRWGLDPHGRVYELTATTVARGSGRNKRYPRPGRTRGSGAAKIDPVIRSYEEAASWLRELWTSRFRQVEVDGLRLNLPEGGVWGLVHRHVTGQIFGRGTLEGKLRSPGVEPLDYPRLSNVLRFIRDNIESAYPDAQHPVRKLWARYTWPDLDAVNLDQAAAWSAGMLQSEPGRGAIREQALALGARSDAGDDKKAVLVAVAAAKTATGAGVEFNRFNEAYAQVKTTSGEPDVRAVVERAKELMGLGPDDRPPPPPPGATDAGGSGRELVGRHRPLAGSGSILSEFIEDVGDFGRGVIKEIGKGVRRFAQNILNVDRDLPWLSQFVVRPLFVMGHMRALEQLGEAMVQGTTAAFDAKAVGVDFARDLTASGTALIAAGPFIPQPWGTLAAAVGVMFVAGGQLALDALNPNSALNTGKLGPDQVVTVDQYGRQIGPDGLPVDPFQRQLELQRQAGLEPNPSEQTADEWRAGSDGLLYGWHQLGSDRWYWLALALDQQQQITGAWYWTEQGWGQLA